MKSIKISLSIASFIVLSLLVNANSTNNYITNPFNTTQINSYYSDAQVSFEQQPFFLNRFEKINSETFKVYGKCGMCKKRIEGALKEIPGIESSNWIVDTQMITVKFNPDIISLDDIHKKIIAVGHDTEKFRAEDTTYNKLPGCCQYERSNQ